MLERWLPFGAAQFAPWPDRPNCGHFFGGCHWYGTDTAGPAYACAVAASSPAYDERATGLSPKQLRAMALAGLRYINTTVLFYNGDLFHQAGLPIPNDFATAKQWTWNAFLSTAQKLTKGDTYGVWNLTSPQSLGAWAWMNGGDMFDNADHPTKLTMSRPETVEAVQFNSDLRTRYRVAPTPDQLNALVKSSSDAVQLFYQGKLGMYIQLYIGQALVNGLKGAFQWDVAPLPTGKPACSTGQAAK
jgi:ABC-type glycerol-3-phosphate transport system substrate-binding protein